MAAETHLLVLIAVLTKHASTRPGPEIIGVITKISNSMGKGNTKSAISLLGIT